MFSCFSPLLSLSHLSFFTFFFFFDVGSSKTVPNCRISLDLSYYFYCSMIGWVYPDFNVTDY